MVHDDSWRDSYDAWKTREPDDHNADDHDYYDGEDADPCFYGHDYDDLDPATGRRTCMCCGHFYYPTAEQLAREEETRRELDALARKEHRREFWRKLTLPIRWPIYRLLECIWPRKSGSVLTDDEIPF